jgi:hypothetical protein
MILMTGQIINRTQASKLPMPADVIERVHLLARRQKANPGLVFTDRNALLWDDGYAGDDHEQQESSSLIMMKVMIRIVTTLLKMPTSRAMMMNQVN